MDLRDIRTRSRRVHVRQFELRIDGFRREAFENVTDAISSARIAEQECPVALISVADRATGQLVLEIRP
jgi:hypothetical protein